MDQNLPVQITGTLATTMIVPIIGIIARYIVVLIKAKVNEIEQKIGNEKLGRYIGLAEDAVCTAVTSVAQTYVEAMKGKGDFDQAAKAEAFETAKQKSLDIMGAAARSALSSACGDIDAWLDNKIEYYVNRNKNQ